jgi:hypothetical protein
MHFSSAMLIGRHTLGIVSSYKMVRVVRLRAMDFNWVESAFSKKVGAEYKHDRNYFMFDLPEGKEIASVGFDAERSSLHEGSALPTAKLISSNKFMTEFAAGVIRKRGFKPSFKITFKSLYDPNFFVD